MVELKQARTSRHVEGDGQMASGIEDLVGESRQDVARAYLNEDARPSLVHRLDLIAKLDRPH
jgi:hypothetical protein